MKRLSSALVLSLALHILLAALVLGILGTWGIWGIRGNNRLPLAGGGGHGVVSVEIIGAGGSGGLSEEESKKPADSNSKTSPKKRGVDSPRSQAAVGEGTGGEGSGPGSGPPGGTNAILAEIRSRIERAKRYPMLARKLGLTGVSLARFQIDPSGRPQSVSLKSSSGQKILDDEALATIQRAAPYPLYAEPLEIGIRFELKDN